MNWIKSNPFVAALAGITILVCGILYLFASKGGTRYASAKAEFDTAFQAVSTSESIPLYPTATNRDAKMKALDDYRKSIDDLRGLFDEYRQDEIANISTQDFTVRLKAANDEVSKALTSAGCEIPDGFFMGFEVYRDELANSEATGLLLYQLNGLKQALLGLAEARPSQLMKVYRDKIPEESGTVPKIDPNDVTRNFGFEVSFKGSEASAREFLTAIGKTEHNYYVVRCVSIKNERDSPPKISDAKFETPRAAPVEAANPFGTFDFGTDDEKEDAPAEDVAEESGDADADNAEVVDAPAPVDSSRILAQVLGAEEVIVFVRFDLNMFLPAKELLKP